MLLKIASLAAVFALVAFNYWLGRSGKMKREKLPASKRIALDLIDFKESRGQALKGGEGYIALGASDDDVAVAHAMGDGWVVRRFGPGHLTSLTHDGADLELRFGDFTLPRLMLHFDDEAQAEEWGAILNACVKQEQKTDALEEEKPYGLA